MKKQVKVDVSWNGSTVCLTTDRGMKYDFVIGNDLMARNCCETAIAVHIAALMVPTISQYFDFSDRLRFRFTFTACDTI